MMQSSRSTVSPLASRTIAIAALASLLACGAFAAPAPSANALRELAARGDSLWRAARGFAPERFAQPGAARAAPAAGARASSFNLDSLDANWQSGYGLPVPNNYISCLIVNDGLLVAGGAFDRIGEMPVRAVATWDGTAWSALGNFPGYEVRELAPTPGGFAALGYSNLGSGVWSWDGTAWQPLESLPIGTGATDLATLDDQLAVSVMFDDAGVWKGRVLLHATGGWTTLGGDFDGNLLALTWANGELFASGEFHNVGGVPCSLVARWDGAGWQPVGGGLPNSPYGNFGSVHDLTEFQGELAAGGSFGDPADPTQAMDFARWNGASWVGLGPGAPATPNVQRLRAIGSDLYVTGVLGSGYGTYGIARWDGSAWHTEGDSLQRFTDDVAMYQNALHAAGALSNDGSRPASPLIRSAGNHWETLPNPGAAMHGFLGVAGPEVLGLGLADGAVVAAGLIRFAGTAGGWKPSHGTARWNGSEWSALGMEPWYYAEAYGMTSCNGVLYAMGLFSANPFDLSSVVRFDGSSWSAVGNPYEPFLNTTAIGSALGNVFVAGFPQSPFHGLARWNGSSWLDVGGGITNGSWIAAIAEFGGDVVVGGAFSEMGGVPCNNIAAWNPKDGWRPLGAGVDRSVLALTSGNGGLYVGGSFSSAGGIPTSCLASWSSGEWSAMPQPQGQVLSLGWYRNHLIASGPLVPSMIASLETNGAWRPLGTGLSDPAYAMIESGPSLFVGGTFSSAGGKSAYGFAEWREPSPAGPALNLAAGPNPFATVAHLRYELPAGAETRVEIFDLSGHVVDRPFVGYQSAGPQDVVWHPTSGRITPGVYFARVRVAGQQSRVVRVVRVQ